MAAILAARVTGLNSPATNSLILLITVDGTTTIPRTLRTLIAARVSRLDDGSAGRAEKRNTIAAADDLVRLHPVIWAERKIALPGSANIFSAAHRTAQTVGELMVRRHEARDPLDVARAQRGIEDRDVEWRLSALGGVEPRYLIMAQNDGLRDAGLGARFERGFQDLAMRFVPGAWKGCSNEGAALSKKLGWHHGQRPCRQ